MSSIIHLDQIKSALSQVDVIAAMREGFIQYSNGNTVVPPVGELIFEDPPGDVHIKYGYIKQDDYYVIKIASGFYENPKRGIASGQGMMLLFNQQTGQLVSVLLDEGHLTDIRTAAAGALAAQHFAQEKPQAIGIIGTGVQAKLQLLQLQQHTPCKTVWLWGRNKDHAEQYRDEFGDEYDIQIADSCAAVAQHADVIITTTPSETPLLAASDIQPGTVIIAVGSDTADKQELDPQILQQADMVIADSLPQSQSRGEIYQAVKAGLIAQDQVLELGHTLQHKHLWRTSPEQIIVVDLTGVAVQDIMIASAVYRNIHQL